jgi:hypothetical protein
MPDCIYASVYICCLWSAHNSLYFSLPAKSVIINGYLGKLVIRCTVQHLRELSKIILNLFSNMSPIVLLGYWFIEYLVALWISLILCLVFRLPLQYLTSVFKGTYHLCSYYRYVK